MEENRNHHEEKSNTGMVIIAIIAVLLVVGLIAYFVMGNNDVEDAIDDVKDTTENIIDNDNDTKTMSDVAGSYQAKLGNSEGIDEDTAADEDDYIELVLREDGTASLIITTNDKNTITGSYTVSDNMVRISSNAATNAGTTGTNATTNTTGANDTNQMYEFTINDDNTLNYLNGTDNVTLSKVENNTLKYIK